VWRDSDGLAGHATPSTSTAFAGQFRRSRQSAALPQPLIKGPYGVLGTISDETCDVNTL
jgi:hypothetical protein